jgi:hypothetical protein
MVAFRIASIRLRDDCVVGLSQLVINMYRVKWFYLGRNFFSNETYKFPTILNEFYQVKPNLDSDRENRPDQFLNWPSRFL